MTRAEVTQLVAILMACYPTARFPDGSVAAYETFLVDLELERAKAAVASLVRTNRFMPAISEIVGAYQALAPRPRRLLREWIPDRDNGQFMPPRELAAAVDEFLARKPPGPS